MECNFLHIMWLSYSLVVTFTGLNVLYFKNVPRIITRLFTFGKVNKSMKEKHNLFQWVEIPKRWFSHFYVFASLYIPFVTVSVCEKYFYNYTNPYLLLLLNVFGSTTRHGLVKPESVIIVSFLVTLQVFRRLYECFYISIYSDSKINLSHYIVGYTFYFGVGLSLVHDAVGFEALSSDTWKNYTFDKWYSMTHCIGVILFLAGFFLQFETHKTFAGLRKSGNKVVSSDHHIPSGGFFEYVSCPHYFAEIVMYLSGCIIFEGRSYTWWLVCLWVFSNQVLTGLMSHQWYKRTFKKYPKHRKAVIPFLI